MPPINKGIAALQQWAKETTSNYEGVNIKDMSSSWKDGLAFCAIIHKYYPDLIDYDSLAKENIYENNRLAFSAAEGLGIPALLDAEDMDILPSPDRLSVITYVAQIYNYLKNKTPADPKSGVKRKPSGKPLAITSANKIETPVAQLPKRHSTSCAICQERIYLMERVNVNGKFYHRSCFKCSQCNERLTMGNYRSVGGLGSETVYECLKHTRERELGITPSISPRNSILRTTSSNDRLDLGSAGIKKPVLRAPLAEQKTEITPSQIQPLRHLPLDAKQANKAKDISPTAGVLDVSRRENIQSTIRATRVAISNDTTNSAPGTITPFTASLKKEDAISSVLAKEERPSTYDHRHTLEPSSKTTKQATTAKEQSSAVAAAIIGAKLAAVGSSHQRADIMALDAVPGKSHASSGSTKPEKAYTSKSEAASKQNGIEQNISQGTCTPTNLTQKNKSGVPHGSLAYQGIVTPRTVKRKGADAGKGEQSTTVNSTVSRAPLKSLELRPAKSHDLRREGSKSSPNVPKKVTPKLGHPGKHRSNIPAVRTTPKSALPKKVSLDELLKRDAGIGQDKAGSTPKARIQGDTESSLLRLSEQHIDTEMQKLSPALQDLLRKDAEALSVTEHRKTDPTIGPSKAVSAKAIGSRKTDLLLKQAKTYGGLKQQNARGDKTVIQHATTSDRGPDTPYKGFSILSPRQSISAVNGGVYMAKPTDTADPKGSTSGQSIFTSKPLLKTSRNLKDKALFPQSERSDKTNTISGISESSLTHSTPRGLYGKDNLIHPVAETNGRRALAGKEHRHEPSSILGLPAASTRGISGRKGPERSIPGDWRSSGAEETIELRKYRNQKIASASDILKTSGHTTATVGNPKLKPVPRKRASLAVPSQPEIREERTAVDDRKLSYDGLTDAQSKPVTGNRLDALSAYQDKQQFQANRPIRRPSEDVSILTALKLDAITAIDYELSQKRNSTPRGSSDHEYAELIFPADKNYAARRPSEETYDSKGQTIEDGSGRILLNTVDGSKRASLQERTPPLRRKVQMESNMPLAEILEELDKVDLQQCQLEIRGKILEEMIRNTPDIESNSPDSMKLLDDWLKLVNEKNGLFRRETELIFMRQEHSLDELHSDIEYQLRCIASKPEAERSEADVRLEKHLISRLVEVINQKNDVVDNQEEERKRQLAEDAGLVDLTKHLEDMRFEPPKNKTRLNKKGRRVKIK